MPAREEKRCEWCLGDALLKKYHDSEWGVLAKSDKKHFEFMMLEVAQAGLSWLTVLRKRDGYRKAFAGFDIKKVARFNDKKIEKLLKNPSIIRNRLKIHAAVANAKAFLELKKEFGSFYEFCLSVLKKAPKMNKWRSMRQLPALTPDSVALSKELKKRGFKFVGPTTVYAHMQAAGLVNDHVVGCYRYKEVGGRARG